MPTLERTCRFLFLSLLLGLAPACTDKKTAATPAHAEGAVPGSHEDWCGEHELPESQCTRCDPSLSAAFRATGDWCAEHDLPESHCQRCDPELVIARPPKAEER